MPDPNPSPPLRVPGDTIVQAANKSFQEDANFRESVRQMHAAGYPLMKMVRDLGLDGEMTDELQHVIENLPPDVVEGIRQATLAMLDSGNYELPLDCTVHSDDLPDGVAVNVAVAPEADVQTIVVRSTAAPATS